MNIFAEVNIKTMRANIKTLRARLAEPCKVCAVLKANAYSLGAPAIALALQDNVEFFAVATIGEGVELRKVGITKPILVFGVCDNILRAVKYNLIISINSTQEALDLAKVMRTSPSKCSVHIKANTGLNRYGITSVWQLKTVLDTLRPCKNISVDGLYTHFAHDENKIAEIDTALSRFMPLRKIITLCRPNAIIHAACSNNAHYAPAQFDMVRVGKLIYGGLDGYKTAITVTSKIVALQSIRTGETVGYDGTFTADNNMTVGIVACGYADLIKFGTCGHVIVGGKKCKILGRICMDTFMIDVTHIENPLGKHVTIIAPTLGMGIMDASHRANTIACDTLCALNFKRAEITYK